MLNIRASGFNISCSHQGSAVKLESFKRGHTLSAERPGAADPLREPLGREEIIRRPFVGEEALDVLGLLLLLASIQNFAIHLGPA